MDAGAVIAARPVRRAVIRSDEPVAGYLYVVCHKPVLTQGRGEALRSAFARPALAAIIGVVALTTLLAAWIIASVTRRGGHPLPVAHSFGALSSNFHPGF